MAVRRGLLTRDQVDYCDPIVMIVIPRLAIVWSVLCLWSTILWLSGYNQRVYESEERMVWGIDVYCENCWTSLCIALMIVCRARRNHINIMHIIRVCSLSCKVSVEVELGVPRSLFLLLIPISHSRVISHHTLISNQITPNWPQLGELRSLSARNCLTLSISHKLSFLSLAREHWEMKDTDDNQVTRSRNNATSMRITSIAQTKLADVSSEQIGK